METRNRVILALSGLVSLVGVLIWSEKEHKKDVARQDAYWKKQREEIDQMLIDSKENLEYLTEHTRELQKEMSDIAESEDGDFMAQIIEELKKQGKWLETEEDLERYLTE